ncbi:MAG: transporter substrate-binding domain-containing protein, partial [Ardenticatenaceae bacterium]
MKKTVILVVLLAFGMLLSACSGDEAAQSTHDRVLKEGVVKIGVRNDNPPMSFVDDSGAWVGFDVDLAHAM